MKLCKKSPIKVLFLGLYGCGKTSIIYKFAYRKDLLTLPTLGSEEINLIIKNKKFIFCDITGQRISIKLWKYYYPLTDIIAYVIDINNLCQNTKEEIDILKDVLKEFYGKVIIVLTKYLQRSRQNINEIKQTLFSYIAEVKRDQSVVIIEYDINDIQNNQLEDSLLKL